MSRTNSNGTDFSSVISLGVRILQVVTLHYIIQVGLLYYGDQFCRRHGEVNLRLYRRKFEELEKINSGVVNSTG